MSAGAAILEEGAERANSQSTQYCNAAQRAAAEAGVDISASNEEPEVIPMNESSAETNQQTSPPVVPQGPGRLEKAARFLSDVWNSDTRIKDACRKVGLEIYGFGPFLIAFPSRA